MSLITHIQVPFCVGLLHPGKRWYYAGGQTGPFGDTLDAIRIETSAPEGEPLLEAVPTETALVLAALDNCEQYGGVIDWANLPEALGVTASAAQVAVDAVVTVSVAGRQGALSVILREGGEVDSASVIDMDTFDFAADEPGVYTIHVFDRLALAHGSVTVEVL